MQKGNEFNTFDQTRLKTFGGPSQNLNKGPLKVNFIWQPLIIPLEIE